MPQNQLFYLILSSQVFWGASCIKAFLASRWRTKAPTQPRQPLQVQRQSDFMHTNRVAPDFFGISKTDIHHFFTTFLPSLCHLVGKS